MCWRAHVLDELDVRRPRGIRAVHPRTSSPPRRVSTLPTPRRRRGWDAVGNALRRKVAPARSVCLDRPRDQGRLSLPRRPRGVVDLLSHHLYSSPRVYLRELLQNAVDAITERTEEDAGAPRRVRVVPANVCPTAGCTSRTPASASTRTASGPCSRRSRPRPSVTPSAWPGELPPRPVRHRPAVVLPRHGRDHRATRRAGSGTWQWVGRDDGTYAVSAAPRPRDEPGTDVALRPRGSAAELLLSARTSSSGSRRPTPPTCPPRPRGGDRDRAGHRRRPALPVGGR